MIKTLDRYRGCLLGLACGDAVGTTVEFSPRGSFAPVVDMVGGGPFRLRAGEWTDDTSMALCLAASLVERGGFDPADQMARYVRWQEEGYLSATGVCFDIGNTVAGALQRFRQTGKPFSGSTHPRSAGNGSIMRLAPIPMFYAPDLVAVAHYAGESSRTTHGAGEAVDACRLFGVMIARALRGDAKEEILFDTRLPGLAPAIADIAAGGYREKTREGVRGSGYVVESLGAALWCFWRSGSYREAVLLATNLGEDADTTAAICGQLAGAYYGAEGLPDEWLAKVAMREYIEELAEGLHRTNRKTW